MARIPIDVAGLSTDGDSAVDVAGDPVSGNSVTNPGDAIIVARNANTAGTARTLSVPFAVTVDGQSVTPRTYTIPAGETHYLGPFDTQRYGSSLSLDVDHGDIRLAAMRPGPSVTSPVRPYDRTILADTPVGYWTLDGTSDGLLDQSGNGYHGTAYNSPTAALGADSSGATAFNGVNQYIDVGDQAAFSAATTGVLTVEAWMSPAVLTFPASQGGGDYIHWLGKSTNGQSEYIARMYNLTPTVEPTRSNRVSGYAFNLAGGLGTGSYFQDTWTANTWMHYVLVINTVDTSTAYPTGYVAVYRDGQRRDKDALSSFNIIPANGTAPLRFGTSSLDSFLQGRLQRIAVYDYELNASQIHSHYRAVVPAVAGSSTLIGNVGSGATQTSGTRVQITVGAAGVPAGSTLLARACHDYTAAGPTVVDSRGNTWTRDRTSANAGTTIRTSVFSCPVQVALREGDVIELRTPVTTAGKAFAVDAFEHAQFTPVNAINGTTNTSTTPGTTLLLTPTVTDILVYGALGVAGPTADTVTDDTVNEMTALTRTGTNSGTSDVTVNGAWKSTGEAIAGQHWLPVLGPSRPWVEVLGVYAAGVPVISPPQQGTARWVADVVSGTSSTSGTTLQVTVPGPDPIPAGHTLIACVGADFTSSGATIADSRSNTWTRDRTSAATGNACRGGVFSCPVATDLQPGDHITVTFPTSITRKAVTITQYSGALVPTVVDAQTGVAGATGSPSTPLTTVTANTLLIAATVVAGPANDAYLADATWTPLATCGTSGNGTADRTVYPQYRIAYTAAAYSYAPQLEGTRAYVAMLVAYRAG